MNSLKDLNRKNSNVLRFTLFLCRRDKRAPQWDSFKFEKSVATLKTNIRESIEKYTFMTQHYVAPRRPDD